MIARPSAKFERPRVHVSLTAKPYEKRSICVLSESQVRDHRGGHDCANHTHHTRGHVADAVVRMEMHWLDAHGRPTNRQTNLACYTSDAAKTWQKEPSGPVHAMQMKVGLKGRHVPAGQREPELVLA